MIVTVIIPVYNLSTCIEVTLVSVLRQRFEGVLEVIVVDDGSSDNSLLLAKRFADSDKRVKVISQANAGISAARNTGISHASGDYIIFVDGDDVLHADAVHLLVQSLHNTQDAVLASGKHVRINFQNQEIHCGSSEQVIADSDAVIQDILCERFDISACAKLFISEKIGKIRFCEGKRINEDKYFLFQYLLQNKGNVISLQNNLYGYLVRSGSVTNSPFSDKTMDMLFFSEKIEKDIVLQKPELSEMARYNNIVTHLAVLKKIIRTGTKAERAKIFPQVKTRMLELANGANKHNMPAHTWEVLVLKYAAPLYGPCVYAFDQLRKCFK